METCPLDAPRPASNEHWDFVAALSISSLYLNANQTYRGYSLLVFDPRHAERVDELSESEWIALSRDLHVATRAIHRTVQPDHMNVEQLGNVIAHLHWHIVPRYRSDPRWGGPIWTTNPADMTVTAIATEERLKLIAQVREALDAAPVWNSAVKS
jgi:diadenosine tetraphosphate (Ap4A) HIT family hydrolase